VQFTDFSVITSELNFSLVMVLVSEKDCMTLKYNCWCISCVLPFCCYLFHHFKDCV